LTLHTLPRQKKTNSKKTLRDTGRGQKPLFFEGSRGDGHRTACGENKRVRNAHILMQRVTHVKRYSGEKEGKRKRKKKKKKTNKPVSNFSIRVRNCANSPIWDDPIIVWRARSSLNAASCRACSCCSSINSLICGRVVGELGLLVDTAARMDAIVNGLSRGVDARPERVRVAGGGTAFVATLRCSCCFCCCCCCGGCFC